MLAMPTSAHMGRGSNPNFLRCLRLFHIANTIATEASIPMIQVHIPPIVPLAPPPKSWNVASIGAIVRPLAIHHASPRHTRSPPSVTMNEGTPT